MNNFSKININKIKKFLQNKGYKMIKTIYSDGYKRGIFTDIDILTLDTMVHDKGGIRAILLEKYEL